GSNVLLRIRLAPVPDSALDVEASYDFHPSDVASGSVLPIQDQFVVLVKQRVWAFMLERDQQYDAADRMQRRYEQDLDRTIKRERGKVAEMTALRRVDLLGIRRWRGPIFDPSHYSNNW